MTVCTFYLRGTCKYGDRCRNEHPADQGQQGFKNQTWSNVSSGAMAVPYTTESMTKDVTPLQDKPLWPLSSYGAAKYEPVVISGLDESPEELRVKAVSALKAGTINEYMKYESGKITASDQVYNNARSNIPQLHDAAFKLSNKGVSSNALGFVSAFGAKSAFGQTANAGSAFNTGAKPLASGAISSGFPQQSTSVFGQQPNSAFGQASAFGSATQPTSAFGQSSLIKPGSGAFGTSVPMTTPSSAFGGTGNGATGGGFSAFASQPSAFASASTQGSVFGQSSFGTSASGPVPSAFGASAQTQSAFSTPAQAPSAFGAPAQTQNAFPAAPAARSAFGAAPPPSQNVFGSTPPAPSALGTQSGFGSSVQHPAAFGSAPTVTQSAFGNSTAAGTPTPSAFGVSNTPTTVPMIIAPTDASTSSLEFSRTKVQVQIKPDRYAALLPTNYMDILPPDVKAAFAAEKFEWGKIPEWIPPKEVR